MWTQLTITFYLKLKNNPMIRLVQEIVHDSYGGITQSWFNWAWEQLGFGYSGGLMDGDMYEAIKTIIEEADDADVDKRYCGILFASVMYNECKFKRKWGPWNFGPEDDIVGEHLGFGLKYIKDHFWMKVGGKWKPKPGIRPLPHYHHQMILGREG